MIDIKYQSLLIPKNIGYCVADRALVIYEEDEQVALLDAQMNAIQLR